MCPHLDLGVALALKARAQRLLRLGRLAPQLLGERRAPRALRIGRRLARLLERARVAALGRLEVARVHLLQLRLLRARRVSRRRGRRLGAPPLLARRRLGRLEPLARVGRGARPLVVQLRLVALARRREARRACVALARNRVVALRRQALAQCARLGLVARALRLELARGVGGGVLGGRREVGAVARDEALHLDLEALLR